MGKRVKFHTDQTPEQFAYLAGILDGEGCFYIGHFKQGKYGSGYQWHVLIRVTSCDEELIIWLENTFGGSKDSRYRWTSKKSAYRPVYNWQCTGAMLDHILPNVYPYLIIKKKQCEIFFEYRKTCKNIGSKRLPDHINEKRIELHKAIRQLNSRWGDHPSKDHGPSALSP